MEELALNSVGDIAREIERGNRAHNEFKSYMEDAVKELSGATEGRAKELAGKMAELNQIVDDALENARKMSLDNEFIVQRIEELEARQKQPGSTKREKIENGYATSFDRLLRSQFKDVDADRECKDFMKQAREGVKTGEFKDITIGVDAQGGFALPEEISRAIERLEISLSPVRRLVKTVQVGSNDYKELVSIHGGTSGWVGETDTRTATGTPNLRERAPSFGELYAYPQISEWALDDIFFNVGQWLTEDVAQDFAQAEGLAVISGDGSNKPTGMLNTTPLTTADDASPLRAAAAYQYQALAAVSSPLVQADFTGDDLIALTYNLKSQYRAGATFVASSQIMSAIRQLKTSGGDYIWQPNFQVGQPPTILGYPTETWEDMAATFTDNAFIVGFGNFQRGYVLADRVGLRIQSETFTNVGYVRFYIRRREGGTVLNNDAVKWLRFADA